MEYIDVNLHKLIKDAFAVTHINSNVNLQYTY